ERRVFRRLNAKVKIHYELIKPEEYKRGKGIYHIGATEDISAGGLLFESNEPLSLGSILELKIELPNGDRFIQCLARVQRVEEIVANKTYDIAIYFLDISGAERTRLNKYVQRK
ncbi:unnamed protein product, partial [marine sediment metagenome]